MKRGGEASLTYASQRTVEFDALGTHWWIETLGDLFSDKLQQKIRSHVAKFEQTYTRFSDTSLLGLLNLRGRLAQPPADMVAMLEYARDMWQASDGVFNISVGGTLQKLGYGRVHGRGDVSAHFWDEVKITSEEIVIPGEISLDFGGFGKGWLIDALGDLLKREWVHHYVINGGGDILVDAPEPLEFALQHPLDLHKSIGTTKIQRGALAVSSSIKRSWQKDGQTHHHIIDPSTGQPSASDVVSTYVRAETALLADTCATILLIAPELERKLTQTYNLKTILLRRNQVVS